MCLRTLRRRICLRNNNKIWSISVKLIFSIQSMSLHMSNMKTVKIVVKNNWLNSQSTKTDRERSMLQPDWCDLWPCTWVQPWWVLWRQQVSFFLLTFLVCLSYLSCVLKSEELQQNTTPPLHTIVKLHHDIAVIVLE